jgi:hypothetical protein
MTELLGTWQAWHRGWIMVGCSIPGPKGTTPDPDTSGRGSWHPGCRIPRGSPIFVRRRTPLPNFRAGWAGTRPRGPSPCRRYGGGPDGREGEVAGETEIKISRLLASNRYWNNIQIKIINELN